MRQNLIVSLFILGVISIVTQAVVLREFSLNFFGNEFFWGIVLASWFFWTALGSIAAEKIPEACKKIFFLGFLCFLATLLFLLEIFFIRFAKSFFILPGEMPDLAFAVFVALFAPAFFCFVLGAWWTIASKSLAESLKNSETEVVNDAYGAEILGFIFGGLVFSFFLTSLSVLFAGVFLLLINAGVILFLKTDQEAFSARIKCLAVLALILFFASLIPALPRLDLKTSALLFKNQGFIESHNTKYGNIAVTKIGNQFNFYENGVFFAATQSSQFAQEFSHFALLQQENPEIILLIGGGINGILNQLLQHPVREIYYLELDPKLIEISQKYLNAETKAAMADSRVKVINIDAKYFLQNTAKKFDSILVDLPSPSTTLINRYYTKEFFSLAQERMNSKGVFETSLPYSPSTAGKNLENLNASIYKTLKAVFGQVIATPNNKIFFLASKGQNLTEDAAVLAQRLEERNIQAPYVTKNYLEFIFLPARIGEAKKLLEKNQDAEINSDFYPRAIFYQTLYWLDYSNLKFSASLKNFSLYFWPLSVLLLVILIAIQQKKKNNLKRNIPAASVAAAGFSLMALEIIIIYVYQASVGYLYYRIALLIAAVMAGMAFGVVYGNRATQKTSNCYDFLKKSHFALIAFCFALFCGFIYLFQIGSFAAKEIVLLILAILAGFFGGIIFPAANRIYLASVQEPQKKTGTIYSADLAGSSAGALLSSVILIPVFGIYQSLLFIVLVNASLLLLLRKPER